MSGHSKWATIKRKKAATDAKRGRIFTRLLREIQVSARMGGGNVEGNPRLKSAVIAAKAQSVPGDNIEKAIKRGTGDMEGATYEEFTYEAYGPAGVAILIKVMTDNRNRSVAEVRHTLTRSGGSLAGANAVAYQFQDKGVVTLAVTAISENELYDAVLEAGAEDIRNDGEHWEVVCEPKTFEGVKAALQKLGKEFSFEFRLIPDTTVKVTGEDVERLLRLVDALDDFNDVQNVVANFEIDDSELEKLNL